MSKYNLSGLWRVDLELVIVKFFQKHWHAIRLFLFLFAINILIYGQKLFHHSLAKDDYARLFLNSLQQHAHWNGRWLGGLIHSFIFKGGLSILPYFNVLLGVFFVTLAGFVSASILKQRKNFNVILVTLLCSTTIFFARNFFFNSNTPVWITTFLGVYGLYVFYNSKYIWSKIVGLVLIVAAISSYQTILQVCLVIVCVRSALDFCTTTNNKELQKIIKNGLFAICFLFLATMIYLLVNWLYVAYFGLEVWGNYSRMTTTHELSYYFTRLFDFIKSIYNAFVDQYNYDVIFYAMFGLSCFGAIGLLSKFYLRFSFIVSILLTSALFFGLTIIISLPHILSADVPFRAFYALGWLMAGFFLFTAGANKIVKNIGIALVVAIIVINSFSINIYFYTAYRQTQADIIRANQITSAIRTQANYQKEPLNFYIVGTKAFTLIGQAEYQALDASWSKYKVFEHFTDLDFKIMKWATYKKIRRELISKAKLINAYPAKDAIFVKDNNVVLFLNTDNLNNDIRESQK